MKRIKFLHCADIHMDMPFTSLGISGDGPSQRRQDLKDALRRIIQIAKAECVDALLISGDLYEHDYVKKSTIGFINSCFQEIQDIRVFIVPGNHDPLIPNSYYRNYNWNSNVHILSAENPYVVLEEVGACIYGIGFKNYHQDGSLLYDIKPIDKKHINILLIHGTVDMNLGRDNYNQMSSENLASLGMDYIALGHFHNRLKGIGAGFINNPGSPEPLGFDEEGEHGVFIGELSKHEGDAASLDLRFVATGRRAYINKTVDIGGLSSDEQVVAKILGEIASDTISDNLYNITLKGYMRDGFRANVPQVVEYLTDRVFFARIKDETAMDYDFEGAMNEPGLKGLFIRKIYSMLDRTEGEYEKKLLLKALYYGLEAMEQGRVDI